MSFRLGVDIGGTFTDGVLLDERTGRVYVEKTPTTPDDLAEACLQIFDAFADRLGIAPDEIATLLHASTIATNALLERRGATIGLLVTHGFRDLLEIGRQVRHELYNVFTTKPVPLVPRKHVFEVRERIDRLGNVVHELQEEDVRAAAEALRREGIDSIAVCFLHSYLNSAHEDRAAEILEELDPGTTVSVSSRIAPEIKEYWRASTTCINAYVGPRVRHYLGRLVDALGQRSFHGSIGIMHSGGGIEGLDTVRDRPFHMIESGPAAGVAAAVNLARGFGSRNALSFDMGGTTAKAGIILDGVARVLSEFEVAASGFSGAAVSKASGYPVIGEVVDLVEVGAGGGSIAWIDSGGHLRVGPQGAGARPGPACYGLGGVMPTITDANLVLGYLNPGYFLGGGMKLSTDAAVDAIRTTCAEPLGLTVEEAARGIVEIANATMISALRLVSVERGHDPHDFCLIAFGGAGPLHAASLATSLGVSVVLVPPNPGVASAWGLLVSDVRHDVRATRILRADAGCPGPLREGFEGLYTRMSSLLERETRRSGFTIEEYVEARYVGQSVRLRLAGPIVGLSDADLVARLRSQLDDEHEREFGYRVEGEPVEIVTIGLTATAAQPSPAAGGEGAEHSPAPATGAPKAWRSVLFMEQRERAETPVFDRHELVVGRPITGPAIIEEFDSSTVVPPGFVADVLATGVLRLEQVDPEGR